MLLHLIFLFTVITSIKTEYSIYSELVPPGGTPKNIEFNKDGLAVNSQRSLSQRAESDNWGDLIYKWRENRDTLLLREVIVNRELASHDRDLVLYATIRGARISSVRVLNFGRSRANCYRIDVAGGDVQVLIRTPALGDPRILIEVYGF